MTRIIQGFLRFRDQVMPHKKTLFTQLSSGQSPQALFISCADSRVNPNLLTQTEPGDLFICRNAGNMVPLPGGPPDGESATIEYAVKALKVKDIIICGHTFCGAMAGLLHPEKLGGLPQMCGWLDHAQELKPWIEGPGAQLAEAERLNELIARNVLLQLEHLKAHPAVAEALAEKKLRLMGWVYHIESGEVDIHDSVKQKWVCMTDMARQQMGRELHVAGALKPSDKQVGPVTY